MPVRMVPVQSSHIKAIGYEPGPQRLHVEYHTGRTYTWDNVPAEEYAGLMTAESHGTYINKHLRRRYAERVYDGAPEPWPEAQLAPATAEDDFVEDDFHTRLERSIAKFHRDARDALQ